MKHIIAGAVLALILAAGISPSYAATTKQDVVAACTGPSSTKDTCKAAVLAFVAELKAQGLKVNEINVAIGQLVAELAATPGLSTEIKQIVAAGIETAATQTTDADQAKAILEVAQQVTTDGGFSGPPPLPAAGSSAA